MRMRGVIAALLLWSWVATAAETPQAGSIVVENRVLTTSDGETLPYELGTLYVRENRADPNSRIIGVGFARFRAVDGAKGPPTFHLPGGPGSSYVSWLDDGSAVSLRRATKMQLPFRAAGDVVMIDQRGFSARGDRLTYPERPVAAPLDRPATIEEGAKAEAAAVLAGVAAHRDHDLAGYTIVACADDVNDLRQALGYDRIVLVGQSFGSQWSLAVMRRHPEIVARAILSGVEPLNNHYRMPSHVFASLQRLTIDADADPRLAPWMPKGGLIEAVRTIRARLARAPVQATVTDEKSGVRSTVTVGIGDLQQALAATSAVDWPALVLSLYAGDYQLLAKLALRERARSLDPAPLIGPLIDTSIGVTPGRLHLLRTDPALDFLGAWNFEGYLAAAPNLPTPDMGDAFRLPVHNETPVLFVQGDWDTSKPIEDVLGIVPFFPHNHLLVVHRGGHIARLQLFERGDPVTRQIVDFARTGDLAGLPHEVELPVPEFRLPSLAPTAARDRSKLSPM
jgi:pimeloyl-ACP methyl ester carboxylesterase